MMSIFKQAAWGSIFLLFMCSNTFSQRILDCPVGNTAAWEAETLSTGGCQVTGRSGDTETPWVLTTSLPCDLSVFNFTQLQECSSKSMNSTTVYCHYNHNGPLSNPVFSYKASNCQENKGDCTFTCYD